MGGSGLKRERHSYNGMISRCYHQQDKKFKNYGARGISVCDSWLEKGGFGHFLDDMGIRPEGQTLERIDVNGDYSLKNCKWATHKEQQRNKRNTKWVTFSGERMSLAEAVERYSDRPYRTVLDRINRYGWSIEDALLIPANQHPEARK